MVTALDLITECNNLNSKNEQSCKHDKILFTVIKKKFKK